MTPNTLQSTSWLAKRLGLSVSTIERLRTRGEGQLPPHLVIGRHTIRYDVGVVEDWLAARQHGRATTPSSPTPNAEPTARKTLFRKRLISATATAKD
ncbi:helix-turn-helix transcriptional regulator [Quatrionicoccus australiensis]|uniref:helix-turn-helix transcriptional regulator n=1 Tax=Quatrionicoccus australiensis TaxID=138118 RepID=UPI001CFADEC0|nr:helix-turn-helix domain-containing protein [Quatrionicoccus australiensis]MCB4360706.1 helix-turn-helix domain-containing protein [Quatrionicoccus australiensis]